MKNLLLLSTPKPIIDYSFLGSHVSSNILFTRLSEAQRTNADGRLENVSANKPRFTFDPVTKQALGLLLEAEGTNNAMNSNDATVWPMSQGNPTLTKNHGTAPDGTSTFNKFVRTTTGPSYKGFDTYKTSENKTIATSIYAKKGAIGNTLAIRIQGTYPNRIDCAFNLSTGEAGTPSSGGSGFSGRSEIIPIGNGIYRCILITDSTDDRVSVSNIFSFNSLNHNQVDCTDVVASSEGYLWGAQVEIAPRASSYIPTKGSTETRSGDSLSFSIPNDVSKLRYTFDDNSTQEVSVSAGPYTVPTTLNRPHIVRIESI